MKGGGGLVLGVSAKSSRWIGVLLTKLGCSWESWLVSSDSCQGAFEIRLLPNSMFCMLFVCQASGCSWLGLHMAALPLEEEGRSPPGSSAEKSWFCSGGSSWMLLYSKLIEVVICLQVSVDMCLQHRSSFIWVGYSKT
eukprot:jgi/Botrbrau1/13258/Bobra.0074s0006.1